MSFHARVAAPISSGPAAGGTDRATSPERERIKQDPRWQAVRMRDRSADGLFVYSVQTTGIYCRPGCAARLADPRNVGFHDTSAEAEKAGFRPCRRCRPDQPSLAQRRAELVAGACRLIEQAESPPSLAALAEQAGLSAQHFHRLFKAATGLTPHHYAAARRADRLRGLLAVSTRVTDAIHDAGFGSSSRFYERSAGMLGMTPTRFRDGGAGEVIRFAIGQCSLGALLVAASDKGLCAILLGDEPDALVRDLHDRFRNACLIGADPEFESTVASVVGLVEAPRIGLDLPLDVRGTAFQLRVWQALSAVPAGSTASYAAIAAAVGQPGAVRAVARACAANALAVAVPCHRVVRSDGTSSGYRWGLERKHALLRREADQAGDPAITAPMHLETGPAR